ncbi:carcinine hydrolase/isopenicillin-N N-acyltransferase family protein [Alginatibacterium sediminis]|nr:carcinine hydrolase/isopenicillin-N N-acyltransferase family protein [Alginatibacterium sediminis]
MKKALIALAVITAATSIASAEHLAGDVLDYYHAEREAVQNGAIVIDLSGQGMEAIAQQLASLPRGEAEEAVLQIAKNAVENNRKVAPEYVEIMERQAQIKGVPVYQLFASIAQADWDINKNFIQAEDTAALTSAVESIRGCTTLAFAETGIVGLNNDMGIGFLHEGDTSVIKTDDTIFLATDGGHFQGMGRHTAAVLNFMGDPSGPAATVDTSNVITTDAAFAAITSSASVEEAFNKLKDFTTHVALNFTVADDSGDHGSIEMTTNGTRIVRGDGGIAHANHNAEMRAEFLSHTPLREANATFADTFAREDAGNAFISYAKERDVNAMQYILSQRPINMAKYDSDFVTVESVVFDTKNGCAYVAGDNPRFSDYTQVCFD